MPLVLSEEQALLKESARDFLRERSPVAALRALRDSEDLEGFSRELWREMAELGWAGMVVAEDHGGLDFGFLGMGLIFEEMGRTLATTPMLSTAMLGATLISRGGTTARQKAWLPGIVAGDRIVALAVDEYGRHAPEQTEAEARKTRAGYLISGGKTFVLEGHVADTLIVLARTAGKPGDRDGLTLFAVDGQDNEITVMDLIMIDSRKAANLMFHEVEATADAVLGEPDRAMDLLEPVLDIARICLAAEMLGIAREAFERTMSYLKERKQFGVPIGSFQALQHRAAELYGELELTQSAVLHALQAADAGSDQLAALAAMAKVRSCRTVERATNEAIQMHGGIGMTDEFDIGFFLKRARVAQQTFGDAAYHLERFATLNNF